MGFFGLCSTDFLSCPYRDGLHALRRSLGGLCSTVIMLLVYYYYVLYPCSCMPTVNKLQLSTQVLSSRTDLAPAHHRDPRRQVIEAMTKDLGKIMVGLDVTTTISVVFCQVDDNSVACT